MVDNWIIFGGWGAGPGLLTPVFGANAVYVDINPLMPSLVRDGVLFDDWRQRICDIVAVRTDIPKKPFGIAGWSTGAIIAWSLAAWLTPAAGVFISATPSFCRRYELAFLYGQKSAVLKAMRKRLEVDPERVLSGFFRQCGMHSAPKASAPSIPCNYSVAQLDAGLHFLEQANLLPVDKSPFPALFLHGNNDTVVPALSGRYFSMKSGGKFAELDGAHAFFMDNPAEVASIVADFTKR